jgi:hypothetical protein
MSALADRRHQAGRSLTFSLGLTPKETPPDHWAKVTQSMSLRRAHGLAAASASRRTTLSTAARPTERCQRWVLSRMVPWTTLILPLVEMSKRPKYPSISLRISDFPNTSNEISAPLRGGTTKSVGREGAELITANLTDGEKTPNWDMLKLRKHVVALRQRKLEMTADQHSRFVALCDRLRGRMTLLIRGHWPSGDQGGHQRRRQGPLRCDFG